MVWRSFTVNQGTDLARGTQDCGQEEAALTIRSSAFAARVFAVLVALSALAEGEALARWEKGTVAALFVVVGLATMLGTFGWLLARQIGWTERQFDLAKQRAAALCDAGSADRDRQPPAVR